MSAYVSSIGYEGSSLVVLWYDQAAKKFDEQIYPASFVPPEGVDWPPLPSSSVPAIIPAKAADPATATATATTPPKVEPPAKSGN